MTRLEEIEKAVETLPEAELKAFRRWFEEFEATRFDARIEADAKAGRLDDLAAAAMRDFAEGRARPL